MSLLRRAGTGWWTLVALVSMSCSARPTDLRSFLPATAGAWALASESPRVYEGDDLFQLIDGGAEVYREYGFVRATAATYRDSAQRKVEVELFEMVDEKAAFGANSFRRGASGVALTVGQESSFDEYYLNFRKGRFLVALTALDRSAANADSLVQIARPLDQRLPGGGTPPLLVQMPPREPEPPTRITYLKGPIALSSFFDLGLPAAPSFQEGVAASYGPIRLIILAHASGDERRSQERAVATRIEGASGGSGRDRPGEQIRVVGCGRLLALVVGSETPAIERLLDRVRGRLGACN